MFGRRECSALKHSHVLWHAIRRTAAFYQDRSSLQSVNQGSISLGLKCKNDSPRTDLGFLTKPCAKNWRRKNSIIMIKHGFIFSLRKFSEYIRDFNKTNGLTLLPIS